MIAPQEIRYVRLGTANLEQAVEFAQKILSLQLAARERSRAYLRSDDREYSLCYVPRSRSSRASQGPR
jgi:2,3-dihydroxy-p-cumate/2,3-dihydroxybenzoate 3,4-dioxygenase